MWYLIIASIIVLILLMVSPLKVNVKYTLQESKDTVPNTTINLASPQSGVRLTFLWGLITFRLRLSAARLGIKSFEPILKIRARLAGRSGSTLAQEKTKVTPLQALHLYKRYRKIYQATSPAVVYLLSRTTLHRFCWQTGLGMYQADQTGIAVGALWIIKSNITTYIYRFLDKPGPRPELKITPVFNARILSMQLNFIFSQRLGNIILAGIMGSWLYLKNRKKF